MRSIGNLRERMRLGDERVRSRDRWARSRDIMVRLEDERVVHGVKDEIRR